MGRYVFKLPDVGEGVTESEIAEWHVAVGDRVEEDQTLVDMLTDKAAVEIPSSVEGTVLELGGDAGDTIAVGAALIEFEVEGYEPDTTDTEETTPAAPESPAAQSTPVDSAPADSAPEQPAAPADEPDATKAGAAGAPYAHQPAQTSGPPRPAGEKPLAAPSVRRRAREYGVHLAYIPGTGPANRITHADLDAYMAGGTGTTSGGPPRSKRTGTREVPVIGLRRRIAEAMQDAKRRIPHYAYVEEIDVTELEALRRHLNTTPATDQPRLTLLPFLVRALDGAIADYPEINATYDDEAGIVTHYDALHAGIATQTDNGLVVPVIHHAETMGVRDIAAEIVRLAQAARDGKTGREELTGSTITVTSLGPLGGIASTPVINAPEVAIVGVNRIVERAVFRNGTVVPRLTMNLSSSFDHRIVDGFRAASFIQHVKNQLEHPATMFLE